MRIGSYCVMPNHWRMLLWPVEMPADWIERVNRADNPKELEALRRSVERGRPYGTPQWQRRTAKRLGLESAYRSPGRPRIARGGSQVPAS